MHILNYVYFLIINIVSIRYISRDIWVVKNPLTKEKNLLVTGVERFWILTFSTGLLALSTPSVFGFDTMSFRLFFLEILCIYAILRHSHKVRCSGFFYLYTLYLLWVIIGIIYSPTPFYGIRVILKYLYPFLIVLIASIVGRRPLIALKSGLGARKIALISIVVFFVPGLSSLFPGVFWYGTAAAIHYIAMCMFSFALFFDAGKDKKNLFLAFLFIVPCVLWVFRTSIMGTALSLMVFFIVKYKIKSLPFIVVVLALFVAAVFYIPSVKEKMFRKDTIDLEMLQAGELKEEDIDSNGRFAMWRWSTERYYKGKELVGSGTGNLQAVFYSLNHPFAPMRIVHNDYVQILCDNGIIGLVLFGLPFLFLIFHCFIVYQNKKYNVMIRVCAITAASSVAGMLLTMYTDNTINYSMSTLSYPCGFYGMMLGLIYNYKRYNNVL